MIDRKSLEPKEYAIGYGKPPRGAQFPAGKSGNPKGRPKGSRSVGAVLKDIMRQKIAVTEKGKTRRISALEVMLRRLANDAMRTDLRALKLMLSLFDRYGDSPEAVLHLDEMLAEDRAILAEFLPELGDPTDKPDDGGNEDGI